MTWIAVAIIGGAVVGGAATVFASGKAEDAAEVQAQAIKESSDKSAAVQWAMFQKSVELTEPWREAGEEALGDLVNMIEAGPGDFVPEDDPGFKFGYEEFIEKPTLRAASATGKLGGGGIQKALTRYASDYASTKYDNFLDRWYQSLTPLQSVAGVGQTTATQQGQQAILTGQNVGQNLLASGRGVGEARASGYINQANIWGGYGSGVGQNLLDFAMLKYYKGSPAGASGGQ